MPKTVHLFASRDWYIPGVPAVDQDVDADRAAELLAYRPPAFTTEPPADPVPTPAPDAPAAPADTEEQ